MGRIVQRKKKKGQSSYKAEIRINRKGQKHYETKTFPTQKLAKGWLKKREYELSRPGALEMESQKGVLVGDVINWYLTEYKDIASFGRSKRMHLEQLLKMDVSKISLVDLSAAYIINHIKTRRLSVSAATANNDLVWLRVAFKTAIPHFPELPINLAIIDSAAQVCRKHKLISKSQKRDRRPTDEELKLMDAHFRLKDSGRSVPMADIIWFAIYSARRESEITRLLWADNDVQGLSGVVRDAKHPTRKEGNHRAFKYTAEAWEIVNRQPKNDARIFPYEPKTIGAYFRHACKFLEIEDLRFHDLRHEATSRLFERGYQIHEVAQFTLHEDWKSLKRYTNLRPADLVLR